MGFFKKKQGPKEKKERPPKVCNFQGQSHQEGMYFCCLSDDYPICEGKDKCPFWREK